MALYWSVCLILRMKKKDPKIPANIAERITWEVDLIEFE